MTWEERVWGYTEPSNMVLGVANGYFWWHAITMIVWYKLYGWSMVAHGICVLAIMIPGLVSCAQLDIIVKRSLNTKL